MNNNLTTSATQYCDFKNPLVMATTILTLGICYCVTVTVNAKYNRDIELKYEDFSLNIHSSAPVTPVVAS